MKNKRFIVLSLLFTNLVYSVFCVGMDFYGTELRTKDFFSYEFEYDVLMFYDSTDTVKFYHPMTDTYKYLVCKDADEARKVAIYLLSLTRTYNDRIGVYDNESYREIKNDYKANEEWRLGSGAQYQLRTTYVNRLMFIFKYFGSHQEELFESNDSYNKQYIEKYACLRNKIYYVGKVKALIDSMCEGELLNLIHKYNIVPVGSGDEWDIGYNNKNEHKFIVEELQDWHNY